MAPNLFFRTFTRNGQRDEDIVADDAFLAAHFTDFFGKWLQEENHAEVQSHDGLVLSFWDDPSKATAPTYDVQTFMVADAGFIVRDKHPESNPLVRFLTLITRKGRSFFSPSASDWTLCIVGGSRPKETSRSESFLQVASWNGTEFRFYQSDFANGDRQLQVWNYFGESMDAFGPNSYLGPFNGHVNGACVMKEIHKPWIHWLGNAGDFDNSFSEEDRAAFRDVVWLTAPSSQLLSLVNSNPALLERNISRGVDGWFNSRRKLDFFGGSNRLVDKPANIPRWMSHLFLTTTINLGAAVTTGVNDRSALGGADYLLPPDHLFDQELLSSAGLTQLMIDTTTGEPASLPRIGFKETDYTQAATTLRLSLLQQVTDPTTVTPDITLPWTALGGDKREPYGMSPVSFKILAENMEGPSPFHIIQSSVEDAVGVQRLQMLKKIPQQDDHDGPDVYLGMFSPETFQAILMVDFWNPVYSWRRGCLMQYVPLETRFDGKSYSLESEFIESVKRSPYALNKITGSPEYEFLQLLSYSVVKHQRTMLGYLTAVEKRMKEEPVAALVDYLTLAESRRRIYRPLPLDEFGPSLPFALALPLHPDQPLMKEMRPDGNIQDIPERGQTFLKAWITSLAGWDPQVIPASDQWSAPVPVAIETLPPPSTLSIPCQRVTISESGAAPPAVTRTNACPFLASRASESRTSSPMAPQGERVPNWTDDILPLIEFPSWVSGNAQRTGKHWVDSMKEYGQWSMTNYDDVKKRAVEIYQHLRSKTMPITRDPKDFWPETAIELFRQWANGGFPKDSSGAPSPSVVIPKPVEPRVEFKTRRDIMSMSKEELAQYQAKLDDVLQVHVLGSLWQKLGILHAYWCLHYQEATFLWHRAYLLYVEKLIGMPIPFWNSYASTTADPASPFAGIPPMFFEETYVHPVDGSIRPNPLKYALAFDGKSKSGKSQFVTRDPTLAKGWSDPDWARKIGLFKTYHAQIQHALQQATYTSKGTAQEFGEPWANIPAFSDDQSDDLYPWRFDFDGLLEQVHDNYHGWIGPDMADNTYTACDPIFLSYHANMDRLVGVFMETHPAAQYTSNYPLQPFVDNGTNLSYGDTRRWRYTTIGDMAKDTRSLGYMYGAPVCADAFVPPSAMGSSIIAPQADGGRAITLPTIAMRNKEEKGSEGASSMHSNDSNCIGASEGRKRKVPAGERQPYVVFADVGCTTLSYRIDVFMAGAPSLVPCVENPDFVGQVTRIGMGPGVERMQPPNHNKGRRCRKPEATRVLSAQKVRKQLEIVSEAAVQIVVTDLGTGERVERAEYERLPGFVPRIVWLSKDA